MKRLLIAGALTLATVSLSGETSAATVSIVPGVSHYSIGAGVSTDNTGITNLAVSTSEYDLIKLSKANLLLDDAKIVKGSSADGAQPDAVATGNSYLSILGSNDGYPYGGRATFSITVPANYFSFNWGSADDYNSLSYKDGTGVWHTVDGSSIVNVIGWQHEGLFELYDSTGIQRVVLLSSDNAFEVGNVNISNVPLPGALAFFAPGLAGLIGMSRRKKA